MSEAKKRKYFLRIIANKVFSPPLNSPKLLTALVDPETTTYSQIKKLVFDRFEKSEKFIPSCFSDLKLNMLGGRLTSAFGMIDEAIISNSMHPAIQTNCCFGGIFSLDASLNQGLPGGRANLDEEEEWFIVRSNQLEAPIRFKSFRLSCSSHVYSPENRYAGIVLYAYKGQTEWWLNGQHCKSGYTVILNTEELIKLSIEEEWPETEGAVHGLVFYYLFRCEIGRSIGEGFAIMNGDVKWNSTTFNARDDSYHDGQRIISESGMKMIDKLIREWKRYGEHNVSLPPNKTFEL